MTYYKIQAIQEFEFMRDLAELKALSNISLERPLTEEEYKKFILLGEKLKGGLKKENEKF